MGVDLNGDIKEALTVLNKGGIILFPTDAAWSIGCDAINESAVQRILDIKRSTETNNLSVLVHSEALMPSYVEDVPDMAYDLIEFTTKPLTLIFDGAKNLAPNLTVEDGSIGIRVSKERFSHNLIQRFKRPIVATSANFSGHSTPNNFSEVSEEIKSKVDYIVSYRQDDDAKPILSSIVKLSADGVIKVIRE